VPTGSASYRFPCTGVLDVAGTHITHRDPHTPPRRLAPQPHRPAAIAEAWDIPPPQRRRRTRLPFVRCLGRVDVDEGRRM
jgi:hypothetical protein